MVVVTGGDFKKLVFLQHFLTFWFLILKILILIETALFHLTSDSDFSKHYFSQFHLLISKVEFYVDISSLARSVFDVFIMKIEGKYG
jgi:hypothetical protein